MAYELAAEELDRAEPGEEGPEAADKHAGARSVPKAAIPVRAMNSRRLDKPGAGSRGFIRAGNVFRNLVLSRKEPNPLPRNWSVRIPNEVGDLTSRKIDLLVPLV